ncbi:MAG TPA: hypothetical protein VMV41_09715 [Cellulomonadaceae bacterium]|nr:hypothetical protein [Cellulomonadaceae bacterium]
MNLSIEQREKIAQFQADGLVWLVNTAVLHPRGLALAVTFDTEDERPDLPVCLQIVGSDEPWIFAPGEQADVLERYERAEAEREARWTDWLSIGKGAP